jgi:hypothetical protein
MADNWFGRTTKKVKDLFDSDNDPSRSVSENNNHALLMKDIKKEAEWKGKDEDLISEEAWKRLDANGGKLEGQQSLAELDKQNAEKPGEGQYRQYGGPQAAAEARHGARESGESEEGAIEAGRTAGMEATAKNGATGIGATLGAGAAAVGGLSALPAAAKVIPKVAKAIPGAAMAAAPLLTGASADKPPAAPSESGVGENGDNEPEEQSASQGAPAGGEGEGGDTGTPGQTTPAITEAERQLNQQAPTPEEKNSLQSAAKRVLGLTGDKKKDAMKWLALSVSAAAHGWRGEPSPLVQQIMDDYKAKREQEFTTSEREAVQEDSQNVREWNAANDEEKMELATKLQKDLAEHSLPLDIAKITALKSVEYDALMKLNEKIASDPEGWAKIQRAQSGKTKMDTIAEWVGIGMTGLQGLGLLLNLGRKQ